MNNYAKPRIVVSRCLGFDACRYNGEMLSSDLVQSLGNHADLVTVCPEVEIGLGTPRDPIQIQELNGKQSLVQPSTGKKLSASMRKFSRAWLASENEVDGFILKSRSPSCGVRDVKIRAPETNMILSSKGTGVFAQEVLARFGAVTVEDEARLSNSRIRDHFLTTVFCLADFRRTRKQGSMRDLVAFHSRNKFVLMAYNQTAMRTMGRLVANPDKLAVEQVYDLYGQELRNAFSRMARYTSHINVLMHGFGYYSQQLKPRERAHYLDCLEQYREGRMELPTLKTMMLSRILHFDLDYLEGQTYFQPYPEELVLIDNKKLNRQRSLA
jgi:uncharacterized protein YbgA (DUF1722 family)/uncharacterized protein YbbK (DUF523 family)